MTDDQRRAARRGADPRPPSIRSAAIWQAVLAAVEPREQDVARPLRVVDLGGGSGGLAVPLAERGHIVTVVDPSPDALASLRRRAREVGVEQRVLAVQGDAATLGDLVPDGEADLVTCHGVFEVLDDDAAVGAAAQALASALAPGGIVSVVAAQRLAAVLARALAGRFEQAQAALTSADGRWGEADPIPRRFDAEQLEQVLTRAGLTVLQVHGVRIFDDLVPAAMLDTDADHAALHHLEEAIAAHPTYAFLGQLGAALHIVARRPDVGAGTDGPGGPDVTDGPDVTGGPGQGHVDPERAG